MATKKAPVKKRATAKKTAPKHKTSTKAASSTDNLQSFKLAKAPSPFLTIAITRQTLYWGIIALAVLIMGMWIIHLQNKVNEIYDKIDAVNASGSAYYHDDTPTKKKSNNN